MRRIEPGLWLHVDGAAGAAGDMLLGAFLDLGVPPEVIAEAFEALEVAGLALSMRRVMRGGITAIKAEVVEGGDPDPDAPHTVRGEETDHVHVHVHDHDHVHDGGHGHEGGHGHAHGHRPYGEVRRIIAGARIGAGVKARALGAFERLGRVEGRMHGVPLEEVLFHEVGGLDAIGDIVASSAALAWLAPAGVSAAPLVLGQGMVRTAHGLLPVPAPATLALLSEVSAPVVRGGPPHELTTPTAAAILAEGVTRWGDAPVGSDVATGYGAGTRELADRPNVVRLSLVRPSAGEAASEELVELVANVDDANPELWPVVLERLFALGARDAWIVPIVMKRGRPAVQVGALVAANLRAAATELLLRETTTLGVRYRAVLREVLDRRTERVQTAYGEVEIKLGLRAGRVWNVAPEHASVRAAAERTGAPLKDVYAAAIAAAAARGLLPEPPA